MIEKVARAFCRAEGDEEDWVNWVAGSRAAIEAMREPTDVMLSAPEHLDPNDSWWPDEPGERNTPEQIYRAMIDAALAEEA